MSLRQAVRDATLVTQQTRQLAKDFNQLAVLGNRDPELLTKVAREQRTERAFALVRRSTQCLEALRSYSAEPCAQRARRQLQHCLRTVQRLNRESPVPHANNSIDIPITEFKNFFRDGCERMYFLALHPFPSAFDFCCTTYVEAPRGYRQELHLHKRSEELTLVLDGESDCVWFQPHGNSWTEAGRVTARAGQAFRIPTRVVHTIENPNRENRNLSVKLTMFIDDRVGKGEPEFQRMRPEVLPVTIDNGIRQDTTFGHRMRFRHEFHGLKFTYRVDVVEPAKSLAIPTQEWFAFAFAGTLVASMDDRMLRSGCILHFRDGENGMLINADSVKAELFSVEDLCFREFVENPQRFRQYPQWCVQPVVRR